MKLKITPCKACLLLLSCFLFGNVTYSQTIRFVKQTASGTADGSSWANASSDLQAMINLSVSGDQVWVAEGLYKPERRPDTPETVTPDNRNNAFTLPDGVALYGGFPNEGDPAWEYRDWETHVSTLSGNLGDSETASDNAYHVVVMIGTGESTLPARTNLDGFTISGGNANDADLEIGAIGDGYPVYHRGGGGIYITSGYVNVGNCSIINNNGIEGGGLYIATYTDINMENTIIEANTGTRGGGLFNTSYNFTNFNQLTILNNTAEYGGGMYNDSSNQGSCSDVTVTNNVATDGGGIYNNYSGGIELHNMEISNNQALMNGGGVYNRGFNTSFLFDAPPAFKNVTITGNTAVNGGGMYCESSRFMMEDIIIHSNSASADGGGIYCTLSGPILKRVSIRGNSAVNGGGLYTIEPGLDAILINVVIAGNAASGYGGAVYNADTGTKLNLMNVTLAGNNAAEGGGMYNHTAAPLLTNTIVYANSSGIANTNATPTLSHSLVQGISGTSDGNIDGVDDALFTAALPFSDAPTTEGNYAVQLASPVINVGDTHAYEDIEFENDNDEADTDVAGNPRISNWELGVPIDMGAYEHTITPDVNGILYVREGATGNGSSWEDASGDLQAMIDAPAAQEIWMGAGTYKPIRNIANRFVVDFDSRDNAFLIRKNVKIYGGFPQGSPSFEERDWNANVTILSGDLGNEGDNSDNSYNVVILRGISGVPLTTETVLNGLTITGGNANGGLYGTGDLDVSQFHGGGMNNDYADITIENVIIRNNTATYAGGGVLNLHSSPIMKNCIISGNVTEDDTVGGAMYNNGFSDAKLTNVLITGNVSGGIYNFTSSPVLTNVTISGNTGHGIINFQVSNPVLRNTIIAGNENQNPDLTNTYNSFVSGVTVSDTEGNIDGSLDPLFVNAPLYTTAPFTGGDYTLQEASPLIDSGNNSFYELAGYDPGTDRDLAGQYRVFDYANGGIINLGAFENNACMTALPSAQSLSFCGEATVANLTAEGIALQWYAAPIAGAPLESATTLQTGTYYVSQTVQACESPRLPVEVSVIVVPVPAGPSVQEIGTDLPEDATIADLIAEGDGIQWYGSLEDIETGNPLSPATVVTDNTLYYATQTIDECESAPLIVTVTSAMGLDDPDAVHFRFYPNPVRTDLHIQASTTIDLITVYTLAGQKIMQEYSSAAASTLDISSLSAGSYLVNVACGNASKSFRIVKANP